MDRQGSGEAERTTEATFAHTVIIRYFNKLHGHFIALQMTITLAFLNISHHYTDPHKIPSKGHELPPEMRPWGPGLFCLQLRFHV